MGVTRKFGTYWHALQTHEASPVAIVGGPEKQSYSDAFEKQNELFEIAERALTVLMRSRYRAFNCCALCFAVYKGLEAAALGE